MFTQIFHFLVVVKDGITEGRKLSKTCAFKTKVPGPERGCLYWSEEIPNGRM